VILHTNAPDARFVGYDRWTGLFCLRILVFFVFDGQMEAIIRKVGGREINGVAMVEINGEVDGSDRVVDLVEGSLD
jgi:hypothetical protein